MDYQKSILTNGLRVITVPMLGVESVTVLITVGVGSRYEEKELNGISHFLEHMAFKGTDKRPSAMAIASLIDGIGGEFNAFTSKDHTGYYIKAAKKHLPTLFDVLSDMLLHSKFDEKEIEKEKGVIIEEINMYEDTPMRKVGDIFENLLYGDTKLGRDIAGRAQVIKKIKREDFLAFTERFYGPGNTVVTVAGGIGEKSKIQNPRLRQGFGGQAKFKLQGKIQNLVDDYLGGWEKKKVQKPDRFSDKQKKPAVLLRHKDTQQAHLCLGFRSIEINHPDKYKLEVLTNILGGGMSSRLFSEVREKRGLAYYVRAGNEMYVDVGNWVSQAGVDVQRIDDAIKVMLQVFAKIREKGVKEDELKKAKENMKGKLILSLEDSRNVASVFASGELLQEEIKTPRQLLEEVDKVTADDVQSVACDIFKEETLNLAVVGPYKEEERFQKLLKF